MLWVWLDPSPEGAALAAASPLPITSGMIKKMSGTAAGAQPGALEGGAPTPTSTSAMATTTATATATPAGPSVQAQGKRAAPFTPGWYFRDLPYSYDVLVENLLDPAHLPFSHHGLSPALSRWVGRGRDGCGWWAGEGVLSASNSVAMLC